MTFAYDAGTTTPNRGGLIEVGSIRLNDGTFEVLAAPGLLFGSADPRLDVSPLPTDDGGVPGLSLRGPREFMLDCQIRVPNVDDLWGAYDLLFGTFDLDNGLQVFTLDTPGWAARRQVTAILNGELAVDPPGDLNGHYATRRTFTVPCIAPDPRIYSVTEHTQTIGTATSVTNAGQKACPIKVRFNGPQTNPKIDRAGTSGSNRIRYAGTIPTGHYVEVSANAASAEGVYAVDDTGVNAMGTDSTYGGPISAFTAREVPKGGSSWTATKDSGSGSTVLYWRDAW